MILSKSHSNDTRIFFHLRAGIVFFLLMLFPLAYFFLYLPMKRELEREVLENFRILSVSKTESLNQFVKRCEEGAVSISSRTFIKDAIVQYLQEEISIEKLREITENRYSDGVRALGNVVFARRYVADSLLVAFYGNGLPDSEPYYNNLLITGKMSDFDAETGFFTFISPITHKSDTLGYDIIAIDPSDLFSALNDSVMTLRLISDDYYDASGLKIDGDNIISVNQVYGITNMLEITSPKLMVFGRIRTITFTNLSTFISLLVFVLFSVYILIELQSRRLQKRAKEAQAQTADAEKSLAEEKEKLSVTLESIADGVIAADPAGNVIFMNDSAASITGFKDNKTSGMRLSEVYQVVYKNSLTGDIPSAEKSNNNEVALLRKNGEEIIISESIAPLHDSNGKIKGSVIVFRNIGEELRIKKALEINSRLNSLGALAGGIAHDFNNLLMGIYGYADMALEDIEDAETAARYIGRVLSSIDRGRSLTNQLLTFSKGGDPVTKKNESLFPFIEESVSFSLSGSSMNSSFSYPDDLKMCDYDPNMLSQVINNIVLNARDASDNSGDLFVFAENIGAEKTGKANLSSGLEYVHIAFKDNGCGIDSSDISHVFDPFFTRKATGQGLGLATSYSIIKKHGGKIEIESEPGSGTTVNIYLPVSSGSDNIESSCEKSVDHEGEGVFIIMDDDPVVRSTLVRMLESFGYKVVETADGKDAVRYAEEAVASDIKVAGIMLDLTVPGGMGGEKAAEVLKKIITGVLLIAVSGYSDHPVIADPLKHGFNGALCKPFRRPTLAGFLNKLSGKDFQCFSG